MSHLLSSAANGLYVIAVTPFTDTGSIDWDSVESLVEFYIGCGVSGITILGMMGEAPKLSDAEAQDVTRRFLVAVRARVPVVVGVSNPGTDNLAELGRFAMAAGACGVMVAPATGLKTEEHVVGYFKVLTERLGADVPVVYQDYPFSTGVNISPQTFVRIVDECPSVVMLKHEDWPGLRKLSAVRRACDGKAHRRVSILCGNGGLYLPQELRRGADGAMTGFAFPEVLVETCRIALAGRFDAAEDVFDRYLALLRHEQQPGIGLAIRKEILRRRGVIRSAHARTPGPKLDADDMRELDGLLDRVKAPEAGKMPDRQDSPALAG
jgi:4-hydroxy-tetrahydrodipicolinate synthase